MRPTPRAQQLAAPVHAALEQLRQALEDRPAFDPASSRRKLVLGATDYGELALLPRLLTGLRRHARHMTVKVRRLPEIFSPPQRELEEGALDLAAGFYTEAAALSARLFSRHLWTERHVCLVRRGHPQIGKSVSLAQYAAAGHAGIFYRGEGPGLIDTALAKRGLERRLVVEAAHFLSVPHVVAATDLIATAPERLAARFCRLLPLRALRLPLDLPPFPFTLLWAERTNSDPALVWLRERLAQPIDRARRQR
jgi:DNA-binding transcriptional LysR family regulator